MVIGAGQQYLPRLWWLALTGQAHRQAGGAAEPFCHARGKYLIHMLDQHDGRRKRRRQALEQYFEGRRAANGRTDRNQPAVL